MTIALIGQWQAYAAGGGAGQVAGVVMVDLDRGVRALQRMLAQERFTWLLIGAGVDDETVEAILGSSQALSHARFGMLGRVDDWSRCERWIRRGCDVYFGEDSQVGTVLAAIDFADRLGVAVIDRRFQLFAVNNRLRPLAKLTARERD